MNGEQRLGHVLDMAFQREFPPIQQRRVGELLAAFHRDQRAVFGQILLRFLTPGNQNSIVDFGGRWRGVIDIKKGLVTSIAPDQEIRNADGKVWHWDDISDLVLDTELNPEKIVAWKHAKRQQKSIAKTPVAPHELALSTDISPGEEIVAVIPEFTEKNIEDISLEILDFLSHYKIPGQKIWVSTEEILEYFKEYKKEDIFEALKLLYEYERTIKKLPSFAPIETAKWRHAT